MNVNYKFSSVLMAELVGTFMLVFAGTCAIAANEMYEGVVSHLGICAVFGLIVLSVIYTLGDISGAHINPAVTVGFYLAKRFPARNVLPYMLAQLTGAAAASFCIKIIFPQSLFLGGTLLNVSVTQGFLIEVLITAWLMLVILNVSEGAKEKGIIAGFVISGTVCLAALFAGPLTGASMNPARSFGPAVISGQMNELWLFFVAPILGVCLAVWTYRLLSTKSEPKLEVSPSAQT